MIKEGDHSEIRDAIMGKSEGLSGIAGAQMPFVG
jgi:hypothetical protein